MLFEVRGSPAQVPSEMVTPNSIDICDLPRNLLDK